MAVDFEKQEMALDILDEAYAAQDEREAAKYAKQALKLDPDLLDARIVLVRTYEPEKQKRELEKLIKGEWQRLIDEKICDDSDIGIFYGIVETRPYMRARYVYMDLLEQMNKLRMAIAEGEDILRLNKNDNMGVRYKLMKLYAMLEDGEKLENMAAEFREANIDFLLPQAIYYYKTDNLTKARRILKQMYMSNQYILNAFDDTIDEYDEEIEEDFSFGGYRIGRASEVMSALLENSQLMETSMAFVQWGEKELCKIAEKI